MIKKSALTLLALLSLGTLSPRSFAAAIPNGLTWLPSDPLNISLEGNHTYDLWLNLASSSNGSRTYINPLFPSIPFPYTIGGNSGYGMFPGNATWATPIKSQLWTSETQGELYKISNGTGGGPFPSGSTIYYGGASPVPNTDGGTLGAKGYAIEDLKTVSFQLSLGEAYGYTLWDADGDGFGIEDMPVLTLYDASGIAIGTLQADYADIIKKAYNGSLDMPPGSGVDEDIYINTFGLQWDLSAYAGQEISSFQVTWTGVQHAQLWSFRLDQTDVAYSDFIFDITSYWTGAIGENWSDAGNWQNNDVASNVGKAVFATGDGVSIAADTTVGQITISSDEDFTISSQNGAKLTAGLNIITESTGGPVDHTVAADLVLPTTVTLDVGQDTTLTISGDMSGIGFYKRGVGLLTLSGDNSFSGNLVFAGGTTVVSGVNTTTGSSILDIKNARVILQGDDRFSSAFGVKLAGTSTPGQRAYLQLGDEGTGAITQTLDSLNAVKPQYVKDLNPTPQTDPPAYVVGGSSEISTLIVKNGIYSGFLGGEGLYDDNLSLVVEGNLVLQGTSTYVGDTVVRTGAVLQVNREAALSADSNLVLDGGLLALGSFSYLTPGGVNDAGITVTESFSSFTRSLGTGAGEVRFTGDGGFRAMGGDRTVNFGGAGAQVVWGQGGFVGDGHKLILGSDFTSKLIFANAIDFGSTARTIQVETNSVAEISGVISGSGGLIKAGTGSLFLSGLNDYTGPTRIEGGQLRLDAIGNAGAPSILGHTSNAASNLILAGGQLNYVGSTNSSTDRLFTIAGPTGTIANDGTGALHFTNTGAIAYNHAGDITFELRGVNNTASRLDALITDNGAYKTSLKKGGSATSANTGGYWILGNENNSYTGSTFINSGILEVTKLSNGGVASSIGASSNAATNLTFFRGGLRYTGDGDSTDRLFSISAFSTAAPNRIESSGSGALKFTNTGALGLTSSAGGATTAIGGGGWLVLGGTNTDDNTLAAAIGGTSTTASRLTKEDVGRWILTGNNSYKGITEILGGVLSVSNLKNGNTNSNIGSSTNVAANLVLNGGTLQYTGALQSIDRLFTIGTSGGAIESSGSGALTFANTGAVALAGTNTARTFTLAGTNTGDNTLASTIGNNGTGATSLVKTGTGKWILSGNNTYTGSTTINGGILQVGANGTTGAITSNVVGSGTLAFNRSDNVTFANTVGGTVRLVKNNSNTLILTGNNTSTGAVQINGGVVQVGNNGTTGSIAGNVVGNGTLAYNRSDDVTYGGVIGETVSLVKNGSNKLTLTGNNTSTGLTTINGGILQVGNNGTTGSIAGNVVGNGTVAYNRSDDVTYGGVIGEAVSLVKNGSNKLTLTGNNTSTGLTTINGGILQVGNGGTSGWLAGDVTGTAGKLVFNRSDDVIFDHSISGAIGLEKLGAGSLTLSAANSFTGQTTLSAGLLILGHADALKYSSVVFNGGHIDYFGDEVDLGEISGSGDQTISEGVTFNVGNTDSGSSEYSGSLNGDGALNKTGNSTLVLSGSSSYSGGTTVSGGTVQASNAAALGSGGVTVASAGSLVIDSGVTLGNDLTLVDGGQVQRDVTSGSDYNLGTTGSVARAGSQTSVNLAGSATSDTQLAYGFTPEGTFSAGNDQVRVSEVFHLSGTGNDVFVLSLSIDGLTPDAFLAWYDGESWVNSVLGNTGGVYDGIYGSLVGDASGLRGFEGSFSLSGASASADYLGAWGVDQTSGTVWAVLNHNSEFTVAAVPEPSTWMLLIGAGCFILFLRRRRRTA